MGKGLISPLFHEGAQNLRATPPCAVLCCLLILIRWRERPIPWAGYSIFNAFLLILWSGGISYVRPFFGGMAASASVPGLHHQQKCSGADDADVEFAAPQGGDEGRRVRRAGLCRFGVVRGSPDSRVSSLEVVTYIDTIRGGLAYEN